MQLFRLSGHLLSHITLCISATFSKGLVSSTLHSTSTLKRLAINYSSSLIVKLSSLPGSLVVLTWFSLVVHSAALSFSGLASCLLHSETLPCPRPRGLTPSTRIVSPCFARPRFQLGLSSRAPPDLAKRARSTLSDRSWLAFSTMYSTLQVLQRGLFSSNARFENCSPAFNSAVSLFVMSESRRCLTYLFRQAKHHFFALNKKTNFIRFCIEPRHATLSCLTRGLLSLYHNRDFYHSIKESHLWNLHCLLNCLLNCMSGWYLALHRHWHLNDSIDDTLRDTLLGMIWTTSTTTFHNLWYGNFVNLPHGLVKNPFLRDRFDTSHNLLLDLRDCHVHNSFNGALLITLLWDQSHNFTHLLHDLRNVHLRLAVWTQHRRASFLRTSVNSFPVSSTYCTSTRGTCTTAFAVKTVKLQQAAQNCIRSTLFRNCLHLVDLRLSSLRYTTSRTWCFHVLRADSTTVTLPCATRIFRNFTFSTYSITCIKSCHSKESLIDVRDDFLLRLHGVTLSLVLGAPSISVAPRVFPSRALPRPRLIAHRHRFPLQVWFFTSHASLVSWSRLGCLPCSCEDLFQLLFFTTSRPVSRPDDTWALRENVSQQL